MAQAGTVGVCSKRQNSSASSAARFLPARYSRFKSARRSRRKRRTSVRSVIGGRQESRFARRELRVFLRGPNHFFHLGMAALSGRAYSFVVEFCINLGTREAPMAKA